LSHRKMFRIEKEAHTLTRARKVQALQTSPLFASSNEICHSSAQRGLLIN